MEAAMEAVVVVEAMMVALQVEEGLVLVAMVAVSSEVEIAWAAQAEE